ncbi:lytic transglycosylase [Corallincola spongiicola]|uniref:Lytic transglycosylase n=1 Tax=Corallincola spongiicola TaxID=2520508 RepID=A0ABY1WVD6_9GAMM|nr:lytic transglycosylase [Corallincola spongiicola]
MRLSEHYLIKRLQNLLDLLLHNDTSYDDFSLIRFSVRAGLAKESVKQEDVTNSLNRPTAARFFAPVGLVSILLLTLFLSSMARAEDGGHLATQRNQYQQALQAINQKDWPQYESLRKQLNHYPLAIYLDYYRLVPNLSHVSGDQALEFINLSQGTPLSIRMKGKYLFKSGAERRWADFLTVSPDAPNDPRLKCYYYRAQLAESHSETAWQGAEKLWVYGKSRPDVCDPLFNAWRKAKPLTDELIWARMLKSFDARQKSLLSYLAKQTSPALTPTAKLLLKLYRDPAALQDELPPSGSPYAADIVSHGLQALAREDAETALKLWQKAQLTYRFSTQQRTAVIKTIAQRSNFQRVTANKVWLDSQLSHIKNDVITETRIRWALKDEDWNSVSKLITYLSKKKQQDDSWRFWRAISYQELGLAQAAIPILDQLAEHRSYYGFLAADLRQKPYKLNNNKVPEASHGQAQLVNLAGFRRVEELMYHDERQLASSEWRLLLQGVEESEQLQLGLMAAKQGWHNLAISAANTAAAWDSLDLRFPTPYLDTFERYASKTGVEKSELMSIARRESAFYPFAESRVGARGLMQLMPGTAKMVSKKLGGAKPSKRQLFDVETNIKLGSAYYKELLERFSNNRIYAVAAYNAGPHRVDRWRNTDITALSAALWIETIPFKETRGYVQAVLSYNVVFRHMMGQPVPLLNPHENTATY